MRRDINFFSVYRSPSDGFGDKFKLISLSLLAGSLIIVLVIFSYLKFTDLSIIGAASVQNAYLQTSSVSQAKNTLDSAKSKLAALAQYKQAADRVSSEFTALPQLDSELLAAIAGMEPSDVTVNSIDYSGAVLTLNCSCTNNLSPAVFVHTLGTSSKFSSVNYTGVTGGTASTSVTNAYSFTVTITLKGGSTK
jgi:Tfp pilus assembly protein PilN